MRSSIFAALAMGAVACSSPAIDPVTEPPPANETTPPPGTPSTTPTPTPTPTTPNPNPDPPLDPASASDCDAFGNAYCGKVYGCNIASANLFVDQASCVARLSGWCKARITAPATGMTHTAITTCVASVNNATCDALPSNEPPAGCAFKGKLAVNAKCALDEQCASGQCSASSFSCGQCLLKNTAGGACTGNEQCDYGHYCTAAKKCAVKPKVGEACSDASGCSASGFCVGGSCVAKAKLGESCDPTFGADPTSTVPPCMDGLALQCSAVTKKCEPAVFAKLGEPCGLIQGEYVFCSGGTACSASGGPGTCQAEVAIGGACTTSNQCAMATECHGGICAYDSASICK